MLKCIYLIITKILLTMKDKTYIEELLNSFDVLFTVASKNGKLLFANNAVFSKLGYSRKEILEMNVLDLHPDEYREEAIIVFDEMIKGNKEFCNIPLKKKDGSNIPVETKAWEAKWLGRDCIFGISSNLSKQREAFDKLQKYFEINPIPIAISDAETGIFIDVNESFLQTLGYLRDEVLGRTSDDLGLFVDPNDRKEITASILKNGKVENAEIRFRTKDGAIRSGLFSGTVIRTQTGNVFLTIMSDITEKISLTEDLLRKESLLRLAVEASIKFLNNINPGNLQSTIDSIIESVGKFYDVDRSYVFIFSDDLKYSSNTNEWCNEGIEPQKENLQNIPSEILSWWIDKLKKGEIINISDVDLLPPEASDIKEILQSQQIETLIVFPLSRGTELVGYFGFDLVGRKRQWQNEEIESVMIFARMITSGFIMLKSEVVEMKVKEQLKSLDLAKDRFLANLSHEMRTPLNGIIGYTELLKSLSLDNEQKEYLSNIETCSKGLLQLVNDILDLSRIKAGTIKLKEEPFYFLKLVNWLKSFFKKQAHDKGTKLLFNIDSSITGLLVGDEERIKQVFINIIGNSIKFTENGKISISCTKRSQDSRELILDVSIKDTGIGVSEEIQKIIFEPFAQENKEYTSERGAGLGLSICKNLIEIMGGNIDIKSLKGRGTTVNFSLRLNKIIETHQIKNIERKRALEKKIKNISILLAEDDTISARLFMEMLKKMGLTCKHVISGTEAFKSVKEKNYHIIFMDVRMPEMDGITATRKIRKMKKGEDQPAIIAVSAYATTEEENNCLKAGMNSYITKPIDMNRIIEIIEKYGKAPVKHNPRKKVNSRSKCISVMMKETQIDEKTCEELIEAFIKQSKSLTKIIREKITIGNTEDVSRPLHRLKGSSANIRAKHIYDNIVQAEKSFIEKDMEKVLTLTGIIEEHIETLAR